MKQRISTFACGLILLFFVIPTLHAQQSNTETTTVTAVQTVTDATGATTVTTETISSGHYLKEVVQQLGLDANQQTDVKIRFLDDDVHQVTLEGSDNEETVFYYRAAKSDAAKESLEKLQITIDEAITKGITDKKPLLGVYTDKKDDHVEITGLVKNSGAQNAGLQMGDRIVAIETNEIHSTMDLRNAILEHEVGDVIMVKYLRQGQLASMEVKLGEQKKNNYQHRNYAISYHYDYKDDYSNDNFQDRDPCKVFIGIYTSKNRKGLRVHKIIDNTPADNSTIQDGDIVLAFNYAPVKSHQELVTERDKSEAGDFFTITVLRDGQEMNIDMQFTECPEEETVEDLSDNLERPVLETPQNNLEIRNFSAFPNPTYGPVTVKFEGEAGPTTVRIMDAAGKIVYQEEIINFDGYYNKDIELKRAVPGTLILTVTQGQEVYSENMVFMPRA
jgi:predicted metalloprotease with PDZ domain